jgi:hypothetical protein
MAEREEGGRFDNLMSLYWLSEVFIFLQVCSAFFWCDLDFLEIRMAGARPAGWWIGRHPTFFGWT